MNKTWQKILSYVLVFTLVICSINLPQKTIKVMAEVGAEKLTKSIDNVVEVVVDGEESTREALKIYRNGLYENDIELSAGTHSYQLFVNGEAYGEQKDIELAESQKVFVRLQDNQVYDSVNNAMDIFHSASFVGDFSNINFVNEEGKTIPISNWKPEDENAELSYIGGGIFTRTFLFDKLVTDVDYFEYKVAFDDNWDYSIGTNGKNGSNVKIKIPAGSDKITIFVDEINSVVYDSISSNPYTVNQNAGNVTYPALQMNVSLIGSVRGDNGWDINEKGYEFYQISDKLFLFQKELESGTYEYKTVMNYTNWYEASGNKVMTIDNKQYVLFMYNAETQELLDSINNKSAIAKTLGLEAGQEESSNRKLTVPGTFPGPSWDAASNEMSYLGDGLYSYTFKDVPAGNYQFKIATGTWAENYGQDGIKDGANYTVIVPKKQDVTVYYNDIISHRAVTSVSYEFAKLNLKGTGINTILQDPGLTGVYSAVVSMEAGKYDDLVLTYNEETKIQIAPIELESDKDITFYFDSATHLYYNDSAKMDINKDSVKYDSKDKKYKSVFGAVQENEKVQFAIETGKDATKAILITKGNELKQYEMEASDAGQSKLWKATASFDTYGRYTYFFAVYYGSYVQVYCDDDGYYGTGVLTNLSELKPYDLVVYKAGFKTPDWMKNAVIYQIFPDRFFNGDTKNDKAQMTSRGDTNYEFVDKWYMYPENPEQEALNPASYPENACKGDSHWNNEIYGGDLKGIVDRIDYLKSLGVNVIYLNPIFSSISSHRYDATDYKQIDPILGDIGDFDALVEVAEENNMHIVLDGVFNHVSDDSIYFDRYYKFIGKNNKVGAYPYWAYVYDQMNNNGVTLEVAESEAKQYFGKRGVTDFSYTKWFKVDNNSMLDDNKEVVKDTIGERQGLPVYTYEGWWGYDSMPVIYSTNGSEYQTGNWAQEVIDGNNSVTQYWINKGSNGWRLDVANEVSDETWQHFRQSVKGLDSDAVIIGEIWDDATEYIIGDMYDSVMNYVFRNAVLSFAKGGNASESVKTLEKLRERYPSEAFYAMMNLVGSHDTARLLSYLDGVDDDRNQKDVDSAFPTYEKTSRTAKQRQYLVAFLQMTYAGAPTIYYGDELGLTGADDPDNRRTMPWGQGNKELVEWYAKLANIRSKYSALRTGSVEPIDTKNENIMGYVRADENASITVLSNNSNNDIEYVLHSAEGELFDIISGEMYSVKNGSVTVNVPAYRGLILTTDVKELDVNYDGLIAGYDERYQVGVEQPEPTVVPTTPIPTSTIEVSTTPVPTTTVVVTPKPTVKPTVKPTKKPTTKVNVVIPVTKIKVDKKKLSVVISWKQNKNVSKYEITYSTDKNFKKNTKKVVTTNKTQKTLKDFRVNKIYYVRVRSVKVIGKKVYYSKYTEVKKVKMK